LILSEIDGIFRQLSHTIVNSSHRLKK